MYFLSTGNYRIAKQLPGALAFFATGIVFYKNFSILKKWKDYIIIPCLIVFVLEHYILKTQLLKPISFGFMVLYAAYSFRFLNNFGKLNQKLDLFFVLLSILFYSHLLISLRNFLLFHCSQFDI